MLTKTLAAAAALSLLVCGGSALAGQKKTAVVGPKQPIPYAQLDAYLKASPKTRASKDWWAGSAMASTGMPADASATAPSMTPSTDMPATPDTSVNPSPSKAPPSLPVTPPTNAAPVPGEPMTPDGSTADTPTAPPTTPPTEPK